MIQNLQESLFKDMKEFSPKQDEYLGKDGEYYCCFCNTRRSHTVDTHLTRIINNGKPFKARVLCNCQSEALKREEEEAQKLIRIGIAKKLVSQSLLGERFYNSNFKDFITDGLDSSIKTAKERAMRYCDIHNEALKKNLGIYFYGPTGTGKTNLMACMANELMRKHLHSCYFTSFNNIKKEIEETFQNRNRDRIKTQMEIYKGIEIADFLFIDDLGIEYFKNSKEGSWIQETFYDIINTRYISNKPTIFTSNFTIEELLETKGIGKPAVDRISEMATVIIPMLGDSYRTRFSKLF